MKHQSLKNNKCLLPGRNQLDGLASGRLFSDQIQRDSQHFAKEYSRVVKNGFVKLKKK
jgi:hypothetical protein